MVVIVAAADIHPAQDRALLMGRILVPVVAEEILSCPPVKAGVRVEEPVVDAIMGVGAVAVDNFAQQAGPDHIEDGQVVAPETPVLEHHAGDFCVLIRSDQLPTLLQRIGRRDLNAGILSGLHGVDGHGRVPLPIGGNDHGVDIVALEQAFVVGLVLAVALGLFLTRLDDHLLGALQVGRLDVAEGGKLNALQAEHDVQETAAAISGAEDGDTDRTLRRPLRGGRSGKGEAELGQERSSGRHA